MGLCASGISSEEHRRAIEAAQQSGAKKGKAARQPEIDGLNKQLDDLKAKLVAMEQNHHDHNADVKVGELGELGTLDDAKMEIARLRSILRLRRKNTKKQLAQEQWSLVQKAAKGGLKKGSSEAKQVESIRRTSAAKIQAFVRDSQQKDTGPGWNSNPKVKKQDEPPPAKVAKAAAAAAATGNGGGLAEASIELDLAAPVGVAGKKASPKAGATASSSGGGKDGKKPGGGGGGGGGGGSSRNVAQKKGAQLQRAKSSGTVGKTGRLSQSRGSSSGPSGSNGSPRASSGSSRGLQRSKSSRMDSVKN